MEDRDPVHFTTAQLASRGDETTQRLLFGPNPVTDEELRALVQTRPALYSRYAAYIGKRGQP